MAQDTEALFDDISRFIAESRALLEAGELMELAGLDDQVRSLCEAVLQLSEGDRLAHAAKLEQLLEDLKRLGEEMVASRDRLAEEIRSVPQYKKASVAYHTMNAVKGMEEDDEDEE